MTGSNEPVVPIRATALPAASLHPLNWTWTESFDVELLSAFMRSHTWYATPAVAVKVISKYEVGDASAGAIFAWPAFAFRSAAPPAAVPSPTRAQLPRMTGAPDGRSTTVTAPDGSGGGAPPVVKLHTEPTR